MREDAAVRVGTAERALEVPDLDGDERRGSVHRRGIHDGRGRGRVEPVQHPALAASGDRAGWVLVQLRERGGRDRRERVELGTETAQRPQQLASGRLAAEEHGLDDDELPATKRLGHLRDGRDLEQPGDGRHLLGGVLRPLSPGAEHLGRTVDRPDQPPRVRLRERVEGDLELGHDPEAAAAAAQRPEQLGVRLGVGVDDLAVGRHDLGGENARRREPVLARQPADAATERVPDDADVGRGAVQRGEPVRDGGLDDVAPDRPGGDACGEPPRVDLHAGHAGGVDEHRSVEGPAGRPVPRALDGDPEPDRAGVVDGCHDVVDGLGKRDDRGALVDGEVPGAPRVVPAGIGREDEDVGRGGGAQGASGVGEL